MTSLQAAVLGLIQGVTEFLPISSSGHLVLVQKLWHIRENNLLFIVMLHLGTVVAVVIAMWKEVRWLIAHPTSWLARMIVVALIPTAVVGAIFEEMFEGLFQSGTTVGFEFVLTGAILWWMDTAAQGEKDEEALTATDALWIGALQGAAILPALSRSGLTIAGGLWRNMTREAAARFSFLLSIPAILGATVIELDDLVEHPAIAASIHWTPIWFGTLAAIVSGYLAIRGTMWLLKTSRMRVFAVYVWVLAVFVLSDQAFFHHWFPALWS